MVFANAFDQYTWELPPLGKPGTQQSRRRFEKMFQDIFYIERMGLAEPRARLPAGGNFRAPFIVLDRCHISKRPARLKREPLLTTVVRDAHNAGNTPRERLVSPCPKDRHHVAG